MVSHSQSHENSILDNQQSEEILKSIDQVEALFLLPKNNNMQDYVIAIFFPQFYR